MVTEERNIDAIRGRHHGRSHRGVDGRGRDAGLPPTRSLLSLLLACTSATAGLAVLSRVVSLPGGVRVEMVQGQLDMAAVVLSLLLVVLCRLRWRLTGSAVAAWLAAAMAAWLAARVLDAMIDTTTLDVALLRWLRLACLLATYGLAIVALRAPDVDTGLSPRRMAVGAAGGLVAALSLAAAAEALGLGPPARGADAVLAVAALLLGAVYYLRCVRRQWPLHGWFATLFLLLGYAHLLVSFGPDRHALGGVGADLLELAGLLAAIGGAVSALAQAWRVQGWRLQEAEQGRLTVEARAEIDRAREAERAHEARNALAAIEGATRALQAHTDRMEPGERAALSAAVTAEIARLQHLVAGRPPEPEYGRFRLVEALAAVVTCERWLGAEIEVDVPDDLVAVGSPTSTAEVVQNLLQNARRHGQGSVQVWADSDDAEVVLRVRDHGPGIPKDEAAIVFERGGRGRAARRRPGSGLGLYVARDLMLAQGGRLWLEDPEEHGPDGACFALALPGFAAAGTLYSVPCPLPDVEVRTDDDRQHLAQAIAQ